MEHDRLAAIRIDRRAIAITVFIDRQLDYVQVRQLSSELQKAESSTTAFINWIIGTFSIESVALERSDAPDEIRRERLTRTAIGALRAASLPIWEVPKNDLLASFGEPPLRTRKALRQVVARIWPVLDSRGQNPLVLDAAAVGLYVQTERMFIID